MKICIHCGCEFSTPPHITEADKEAILCSELCKDGHERFLETVRSIEEPQNQMMLPFVAP